MPMPKVIAFDTETWLIQPGNLTPKVVCLTWHDGETSDILVGEDIFEWARKALSGTDLLVGQNVAYDLGVLVAGDPTLIPLVFKALEDGRIRDTMIREKLLLLAQGRLSFDYKMKRKPKFSLAAHVMRHFRIDISASKQGDDVWRLRYSELDGVPLHQWPVDAAAYAIEDAEWTWKVHESQSQPYRSLGEVYASEKGVRNEDDQVRAAWALHLMSVWGLRTDAIAVDALEGRLRPEVEAMQQTLLDAGLMKSKTVKGEVRRSKDMAALRERIKSAYSDQGKKTPLTTKGSISTSGEVLKQSGDALLISLGELSGTEKLLTAFVPMLKMGVKAPLNPGYDVLKETGRTSSFRPNIQQMPRVGGVRECFVPRAGNAFIAVDYSTLELCTLGQVCLDLFGFSRMADLINDGIDLHYWMGAVVAGVSYAEIQEHEKGKEYRQLAKALSFGYPGGLGAKTFVAFAKATYGVEVTEEEAVSYKQLWLGTFPEMENFFQHVSQQTQFGEGFTVRQLRSGRHRGDASYCSGCNSYFQGLAADGCKEALWRVAQECYADPLSPLYGVGKPVAFIHDEIIVEAPVEKVSLVAKRLSEVMISAMRVYTPDVRISVEATAMLRWSKAAKPVFCMGNLQVWYPQ
jgi:DNA polymerase-1